MRNDMRDVIPLQWMCICTTNHLICMPPLRPHPRKYLKQHEVSESMQQQWNIWCLNLWYSSMWKNKQRHMYITDQYDPCHIGKQTPTQLNTAPQLCTLNHATTRYRTCIPSTHTVTQHPSNPFWPAHQLHYTTFNPSSQSPNTHSITVQLHPLACKSKGSQPRPLLWRRPLGPDGMDGRVGNTLKDNQDTHLYIQIIRMDRVSKSMDFNFLSTTKPQTSPDSQHA